MSSPVKSAAVSSATAALTGHKHEQDKDQVLFSRASDRNESHEEIWDDRALIRAYDKSVGRIKRAIGAKIANERHHIATAVSVDSAALKSAASKNEWKINDLCRAVYSEDGLVYPARIISIDNNQATERFKCKIQYLYYLNEEEKFLDEIEDYDRDNKEEGDEDDDDEDEYDDEDADEDEDEVEEEEDEEDVGEEKKEKKKSEDSNNKKNNQINELDENKRKNKQQSTMAGKSSRPSSLWAGLPLPPPPPPPPLPISSSRFKIGSGQTHQQQQQTPSDEDVLYSMLMSWYMSGYHTGYYFGLMQAGSQQNKKKTITEKR
jgi:survival motor neuron protein